MNWLIEGFLHALNGAGFARQFASEDPFEHMHRALAMLHPKRTYKRGDAFVLRFGYVLRDDDLRKLEDILAEFSSTLNEAGIFSYIIDAKDGRKSPKTIASLSSRQEK